MAVRAATSRKLYWIMIWSIQPHSAAASTISGSRASWQLRPQNRILPAFFSASNAALTPGSRSSAIWSPAMPWR